MAVISVWRSISLRFGGHKFPCVINNAVGLQIEEDLQRLERAAGMRGDPDDYNGRNPDTGKLEDESGMSETGISVYRLASYSICWGWEGRPHVFGHGRPST